MMNDWNRVSVYFFYLLTHGHRQFNGLAAKNPKRNQNSKFQVTPVFSLRYLKYNLFVMINMFVKIMLYVELQNKNLQRFKYSSAIWHFYEIYTYFWLFKALSVSYIFWNVMMV